MKRSHLLRSASAVAAVTLGAVTFATGSASASAGNGVTRAAAPPGSIRHVMVIELENEDESSTFGAGSPATYLNGTLVPQGELLPNYYATGHVSADNYIAQVSGQAPNLVSSSDCITNLTTEAGSFNDVTPGTLDPNQARYPGQVDGLGCVYPASVQTIGNQLDASPVRTSSISWREYAEDMGNDPARDGGRPDPLGGTDCAHPTQVNGQAGDDTNAAEGPNATGSQVKSLISDQYADRHNGVIYFHSVIDNPAYCDQHVVPLGTVTPGTGGQPDTYQGHLAQDLTHEHTTPEFSFITPNLCDDGHDATCAGTNSAGGTTGGLAGFDTWLRNWMPLILGSPAYRDGSLLVVITADEGAIGDSTAADNEQPGPGSANPGYSPLLNQPIAAFGNLTYYQILGVTGVTPGQAPPPGTMPGGGPTGALLLNSRWIQPGSVDTTAYNHYSALRSYEDLLGIRQGGSDGEGHLGMAGMQGLAPFGPDVFNRLTSKGQQ
jgi:hypothetical protein